MADAVAAQIVDFIAALLPPLAVGGEVLVAPPGDPAAFPALHLSDDGEDILQQDTRHIRARLALSVTGYVRGAGEEAWRAARNLDAEVLAAIMADQTAGGIATFIEAGGLAIEPVTLAKNRTVSFRRGFLVDFTYLTADPSTPAG